MLLGSRARTIRDLHRRMMEAAALALELAPELAKARVRQEQAAARHEETARLLAAQIQHHTEQWVAADGNIATIEELLRPLDRWSARLHHWFWKLVRGKAESAYAERTREYVSLTPQQLALELTEQQDKSRDARDAVRQLKAELTDSEVAATATRDSLNELDRLREAYQAEAARLDRKIDHELRLVFQRLSLAELAQRIQEIGEAELEVALGPLVLELRGDPAGGESEATDEAPPVQEGSDSATALTREIAWAIDQGWRLHRPTSYAGQSLLGGLGDTQAPYQDTLLAHAVLERFLEVRKWEAGPLTRELPRWIERALTAGQQQHLAGLNGATTFSQSREDVLRRIRNLLGLAKGG